MIDLLITLLQGFGLFWVVIFAWAAFAPFETLGWWAGWFGDKVYFEDLPSSGQGHTRHSTAQCFIVFLSGVGRVSGQTLSRREMGFLQRLAEKMPSAVVIDDIFPYSVNNLPLTGQPFFASIWRWALRRKLSRRRLEQLAGYLINTRNIFQVAISADPRFGPIYNQALSQVLVQGLQQRGFDLENPKPVIVMGYSGAGQIALACVTYLQEWITAPITMISLGGVLTNDPGVLAAHHVYHLQGQLDNAQKLGLWFSPGRWPIFRSSYWNRARRAGKITFVDMGKMGHTGRAGYLDIKTLLPDGRSYLEHTVDTIIGLVQQIVDESPTHILAGPAVEPLA